MAVGLLCVFLCVKISNAQVKIGFLDSEAIMQKLPEAQDAQRQLDVLVSQWQGEITKMKNEWQRKYEEYDKKKLIMSDQTRADAEKELMDLEKREADYRNQKFGQNGEMFLKENELLKPVHNKIFKAIQEIAQELGYDYVFDKSGDILLLYANDKFDLTSKVLQKLQVPSTK